MAAEEMMRFGTAAARRRCCRTRNFGSSNQPSAVKMRDALALLREQAPWLEVDGEMHGDTALDARLPRRADAATAPLAARPTCSCCPNIDAANIAYNLLKTAAGGGIAIGPVLLGAAKPVHILTPSATVRRIVNMTALTVVDANAARLIDPPPDASCEGPASCAGADCRGDRASTATRAAVHAALAASAGLQSSNIFRISCTCEPADVADEFVQHNRSTVATCCEHTLHTLRSAQY